MPATPTVSVWPQNISAGPLRFPSMTPTTFGRPSATGSIDTSRPLRGKYQARPPATSRSPFAGGMGAGFTESIARGPRGSGMTGSIEGVSFPRQAARLKPSRDIDADLTSRSAQALQPRDQTNAPDAG